MWKKLDFVIKGILIYSVLGFAFCTANQMALKYIALGNLWLHPLIVMGLLCLLYRLFNYDKEMNIKIFNCINIAYLFPIITAIVIFLYDSLQIV
jgi:hypothetical protein